VQQHAEAARLEPRHRRAEQEHVLEHAAGQGDRAQAGLVAQPEAARFDQGGDAVVEAGGDEGGGDATRSVGC
jgi:hypothetical protein